jgi:hypothetical protein
MMRKLKLSTMQSRTCQLALNLRQEDSPKEEARELLLEVEAQDLEEAQDLVVGAPDQVEATDQVVARETMVAAPETTVEVPEAQGGVEDLEAETSLRSSREPVLLHGLTLVRLQSSPQMKVMTFSFNE